MLENLDRRKFLKLGGAATAMSLGGSTVLGQIAARPLRDCAEFCA